MVITVGRQYGSGGREIGTMLAKQLGIAYYDDMLLKEAAEESGLCEELFRSFDERPKSFLYSIAMDPYSFSMNHVTPKGSIEQQVYLATYDTIKKLADKGPCVLIGRCADYALKDRDDVINLFITAPLENRIKRVAARNGISENEAKDRIKKTDKSRASYYSIAMDPYSFSMNHVTPKGSIEQQVYLATYDTIKKLADKGPCVLIGRCADYALKDRDDVINLFITAPLENRIKRVAARNGISENEAKDRIKKTDKSRASYYNYYSAKDWGDAKSYDLCIDSSLLGIDGTVELLKDLIRIKGIK